MSDGQFAAAVDNGAAVADFRIIVLKFAAGKNAFAAGAADFYGAGFGCVVAFKQRLTDVYFSVAVNCAAVV